MCLTEVYNALEAIKHAPGRLHKKRLIYKYLNKVGRPFYMTLKYGVDPAIQFCIKKTKYQPNIKAARDSVEIFDFLDELANKEEPEQDDYFKLIALCSCDEHTVNIVNRILKKDLGCGIGPAYIDDIILGMDNVGMMKPGIEVDILPKYNKIGPNINLFVARCGGFENVVGQFALKGTRLRHVGGNYIDIKGKNQNKYSFMDEHIKHFYEILKDSFHTRKSVFPYELDGVMYYTGEEDIDFDIMKSIPEKYHNDFIYYVFDLPNTDMFQKDRIEILERTGETECVKPLQTFRFKDKEELMSTFISGFPLNNTGLILKNELVKYIPRKSEEWCFVNEYKTMVLPVKEVIGGDTGSKEGFHRVVKVFVCDYNGKDIPVGQGMCKDHKAKEYLRRPPKYIEVRYDEIKYGVLTNPMFYRVSSKKEMENNK
jgi:hypothetical protein